MDTQPINVVVRPDMDTTNISRSLGSIMEKTFENYYTVSDETFIPHCTIYQAQYPTKNYDLIKSKLLDISKNTKKFELKVGPYELHANSYVWWNIEKTDELNDLHYKVLNELNPLREGQLLNFIRPDFTGYLNGPDFSKEESENVKKYGSIVVDKIFQPHLTIGKTRNKIYEKNMEILPETESAFKVDEIIIGKMGDHGTVTKILERFPLQGK